MVIDGSVHITFEFGTMQSNQIEGIVQPNSSKEAALTDASWPVFDIEILKSRHHTLWQQAAQPPTVTTVISDSLQLIGFTSTPFSIYQPNEIPTIYQPNEIPTTQQHFALVLAMSLVRSPFVDTVEQGGFRPFCIPINVLWHSAAATEVESISEDTVTVALNDISWERFGCLLCSQRKSVASNTDFSSNSNCTSGTTGTDCIPAIHMNQLQFYLRPFHAISPVADDGNHSDEEANMHCLMVSLERCRVENCLLTSSFPGFDRTLTQAIQLGTTSK
jgi:hypothetical protein